MTPEPARRRVLVMGASGFVGSHVTRKLVERGDDVRVYLRKSSNTVAIDDLDVERAFGDLRDDEALRSRHVRPRRGVLLRGGYPLLPA